MKKIAVGSWAFVFNQAEEIDFHTVLHRLHDLGLDGVELGTVGKHPSPATHDTRAKRAALKKEVADHGLAFSGLAPNLWAHKLLSVEDSGPYVADFAKHLFFAEDLGIDLIRVDSVEPPTVLERVDPKVAFDRAVRAWDLCAKLAADRGVRVAWEFEQCFAFNKPAEVVAVVDAVQACGNPNFGVLFDTSNAHLCAAGANQVGPKETLPGGAIELLEKLRGRIAHVHLSDSDNTLNEHNTSTHAPFGKGVLNFDELLPAIAAAGVPDDWWCIDLCFWPDAWTVTADGAKFLTAMRQKHAK
jgi:sugar phosphate isomerase/epimerase